MNKLIIFIYTLCISSLTLAFDTEIYGTAGNTENNRVNPNVLFIMDNSGSMRGEVNTIIEAYDYSKDDYAAGWNKDYYFDDDAGASDGYDADDFNSNCNDELADLATETDGKIRVRLRWQSNKWSCTNNGGNNYDLYSANYLNWINDTAYYIKSTRMDIVKAVIDDLAQNLEDVNLGLMKFNTSEGGLVDVPVADIETNRDTIRNTIKNYTPSTWTPLTETLHEAARYYRGESKIYGGSGSYTSPITAECQKNHIILFTDGEPTEDVSSNEAIQGLVSGMVLDPLETSLDSSCGGDFSDGKNGDSDADGECMEELTYWMRNTDHAPDTFSGNQYISTYTIGGFGLTSAATKLGNTARLGGGAFYAADNASEISEVLTSIFLDILSTDSTFTAPAVSVNAFNASEHNDELFYALFRPDDKTKWAGNLKKYTLSTDGIVMDASSTPKPAIDVDTGYFDDNAVGTWNNVFTSDGTTPIPDGKNVTRGGMANLLIPGDRSLYTENASNVLGSLDSIASKANFDMTSNTTEEFEKVRDWAKGIDVLDANGNLSFTDSRNSIGDPLHSEPVIITYGGTATSPDSTIFFGTNEGFLHAIDTDTGREEFAYIPQELLKIQKTYYENPAFNDKPYGMDGLISTWFYDLNDNGVIYDSTGTLETGDVDGVTTEEHAYIYDGMRRGGSSYYGLDVTDRENPSMLFKITPSSAGFEKLGETWARMTVAKVKFNKESKFVLLFTGGYDTNQDSNDTHEDDTKGNAIYMVDATTGTLLWTASNSGDDLTITEMTNSMPASLSAVDISGDGHIDYLFAADTGGRVFRIDINQSNSGAGDFAKGGVIASIAGSDAEENRRFYNKPNVALVKDEELGDYLTIAIGSGYRAHPILTTDVENRFYVLKDFNPYSAPDSYTKLTETASDVADKIFDASGMINGSIKYPGETGYDASKFAEIRSNILASGGWFVKMPNTGEKVLAESTTFSGAIIFTSFSPSSSPSSSACGADTGTSRIYVLDQKWVQPVIDLNNDGIFDKNDASKVLVHSGIAPRPVVIYRPGGGKTIAIGTETIDDERFEEKASTACDSGDDCAKQVSKCETQNCYVSPVYWRQNDN